MNTTDSKGTEIEGAAGGPEDWVPATGLAEALPVRLLRAREAIMQLYRPLFRDANISERQWRVLRNLFDEPFLEPSELALRSFMQPPNVSRVLNELTKLGLVTRTASGTDQRRAQVSLTPEGKAATTRVGKLIEARTAELQATPEAELLPELGQVLEVLIDLPVKHPHLTRSPVQPPGP
ncbi:MarR family transcriptional regulator [Oceanicola sp. 502str15]|uniref:MarR family transcriptional regulator n=1 Tax=Oceanicola sp. 502str15 TaxID=2696061 RepID=UPI0020959B83|nr:MarR family transcriptional regulator [Oceanicola sp. 502str15]